MLHFLMHPRDLWGFSLIGQYGSGYPYTPTLSQNVSTLLTK